MYPDKPAKISKGNTGGCGGLNITNKYVIELVGDRFQIN